MKKINISFLAAFIFAIFIPGFIKTARVNAQSPTYTWAKNIGSTSTDMGYSIAVDGSGNVYITGSFQGTADFDPGSGTANLSSLGDDTYFAKYDASGAYIWAKLIAGGWSSGNSIAVDVSGSVYITGYFNGTADFDPGAGTANLTATGTSDIFFAKYSGTVIGVQQSSFAAFDIIVYPTLSSGKFTIQTSNVQYPISNIEIYNALGEKVYEESPRPKESKEINITLPSGLGQGIYFLQLKTEQDIITQKLIIQK